MTLATSTTVTPFSNDTRIPHPSAKLTESACQLLQNADETLDSAPGMLSSVRPTVLQKFRSPRLTDLLCNIRTIA
jgi:hypothetical protein